MYVVEKRIQHKWEFIYLIPTFYFCESVQVSRSGGIEKMRFLSVFLTIERRCKITNNSRFGKIKVFRTLALYSWKLHKVKWFQRSLSYLKLAFQSLYGTCRSACQFSDIGNFVAFPRAKGDRLFLPFLIMVTRCGGCSRCGGPDTADVLFFFVCCIGFAIRYCLVSGFSIRQH